MNAGMGTETVHELNDLRRGRGLNTADLGTRIGPRLRSACGVTDSDSPALVRRRVVLRLTALCEQLPDDLRIAASVALALHDEAAGEFLDRRITWLADHFERDPRTARRRVDTAFRLLGERLDDERPGREDFGLGPVDGWYVESLDAVLRLDLEPVALIEERRIVATVDDLKEVTVSLRTPRTGMPADHDLIEAEMLDGGEIVDVRRLGVGHSRFVIRLPEALRLGQRHEFAVRFTGRPLSLDVLTTFQRYERVALRVRFGGAQPDLVWQLEPEDMTSGLQWSA